jgi:hypothetical protein
MSASMSLSGTAESAAPELVSISGAGVTRTITLDPSVTGGFYNIGVVGGASIQDVYPTEMTWNYPTGAVTAVCNNSGAFGAATVTGTTGTPGVEYVLTFSSDPGDVYVDGSNLT